MLSSCFQLTPVGTTIFQGIKAVDADAGVNGLAEYFIVEAPTASSSASDGFGYFSINLPHQGQVTVNRSLDYERTQKYLLRFKTYPENSDGLDSQRARHNRQSRYCFLPSEGT